MDTNKTLAIVRAVNGSSLSDVKKTVQSVLPLVDSVYLSYPSTALDGTALNAELPDPKIVRKFDQLPAALLNDLHSAEHDLTTDYYGVVLYMMAGFPIKPEVLPVILNAAKTGTSLQIFRDHPSSPTEVEFSRRWLQVQPWWVELQGGLNTTIFANNRFFCVQMPFLSTLPLPREEALTGMEASLLAGAAVVQKAVMRSLPPVMLIQAAPAPAPVQPPAPAPTPQPAPVVPVVPQKNTNPLDFQKLWDNPEPFAKVYPDIALRYNELRARILAPGCAQCVRNSLTHQLLQEIDKTSAVPRDYSPFAAFPELVDALKKRSPAAVVPYSQKGPRPTCLNCVRKHIGQAVVLLGESMQGYPAHRWLAIGHLGEAGEECVERYPKLAEEIRTIRNKTTDDLTFMPNLMELFDKIDVLEKTPA